MNTKKKKRIALNIAINLTIAAAKGGATHSPATMLSESYRTALALLDDRDREQEDETPRHNHKDQG
ncbi:hypothetical protein U14_04294 [Candidatus Moduliflexus flocculans]|uniref:Uncharacterized protein n=1 Tax=Candidatus Moduliflexus flocculans TaxID=1499966 RepID=A0A0S6W3N3_9BACT|nr:hypothetical protein U14_04294 [Candidatus Moduliflexus flocculans]